MEEFCKNCLNKMQILSTDHFNLTDNRHVEKVTYWCPYCGTALLVSMERNYYFNTSIKSEWKIPKKNV